MVGGFLPTCAKLLALERTGDGPEEDIFCCCCGDISPESSADRRAGEREPVSDEEALRRGDSIGGIARSPVEAARERERPCSCCCCGGTSSVGVAAPELAVLREPPVDALSKAPRLMSAVSTKLLSRAASRLCSSGCSSAPDRPSRSAHHPNELVHTTHPLQQKCPRDLAVCRAWK